MIWFLFILLIVLLLMAGAGHVVLLVLGGFAAVMAVGIVVHIVRQFTNPAYRAEVERNAEKRKSKKAQKRGWSKNEWDALPQCLKDAFKER